MTRPALRARLARVPRAAGRTLLPLALVALTATGAVVVPGLLAPDDGAAPTAATPSAPLGRPAVHVDRAVAPEQAAASQVPLDGALTWRRVSVGGTARRYLVATPPGDAPHPLLVVLHGLGQRTEPFLRQTGVVQAALAAGVAVAGPETPDASWNDGRFGATGRDDDGYVLAVVDQLVAQGVADPRRVVLAGYSNGAGLSAELASRHPGRFRSLVLVGGELLAGPDAPRPTSPVPTLLVHGTHDPVQPWAGRPRHSARMPAQIGVPATVDAFVAAARAGAPQPAQQLPTGTDRIPVTVQRWVGPEADVSLYSLVGAGHVWPVTTCPAATACAPGKDVARLADVSATALAVEAALTS